MPTDETIPTIAELKGNTILELFKNGYNTLKNALFRKQNKLIAGDNIIIDEATNRISAIEGGTAVLEDYYTKTEVDGFLTDIDEELDSKADSADVYDKTDVYTKSEVDELIENVEVDAYTKSETDTLLSGKADKSDTYTKSEVDGLIETVEVDAYTKSESDLLLNAKADKADTYTKTEVLNLINTAEGNCNIHSITLGTVSYDTSTDTAYIPVLDEIKNGDIIIFRACNTYSARNVDTYICYTDSNNGVRGTEATIREDFNLGSTPGFFIRRAGFYDNGSTKQFRFDVLDYNWAGTTRVTGTTFSHHYTFECYVLRKVVGGS